MGGGGNVCSPARTPLNVNVVEMTAKSPESSEADMEVDDLHSHLGTILAVAEDSPNQPESKIVGDQDPPLDKNGNEGAVLKVVSMADPAGAGSRGETRVEQGPAGRLGSRVDITPPILNGAPAGVKSTDRTPAQVLPRNHADGLANDREGPSEEKDWHLLPAKSDSISCLKSPKAGEVVRLSRDEPLPGHREQSSTVPEQQPGSMIDQIAVALDSGETGTGSGDRQNVSEGNKSAEVVDAGKIHGAAALVMQTAPSSNKTPSVTDDKKPEATTQQSPAIVIQEIGGFDSSHVESHIRRPTRSSMRLLEKKSYAESSEDEQARVSRSNPGSGSKGAGGQVAKQKRNDASGKAHPGTTGTKASISVANTDRPFATVAASISTSRPMKKLPDWEIQLRKIPSWELELEMWKERELFRCDTIGIVPHF